MKLIVFVYFLLFSCDFGSVSRELCGDSDKAAGLLGCCASEKNGCVKIPKTRFYTCWCEKCEYLDNKTGKCPEGSELATAPPSMVMTTTSLSTIVTTIPINIGTTTTSDGGEVNNNGETHTQSADDGDASSGVGVVRGNVVVAIVTVCMMAMVVGGGIGVGALLMVTGQLGKTV